MYSNGDPDAHRLERMPIAQAIRRPRMYSWDEARVGLQPRQHRALAKQP
ncbi:Hypothetical protein A7982_05188 [Minicystis rosea]|nr:Hypothetical protein A7982_05188 [Minicystis rosea]